jgi:hypothetical protein
MDRLYAGQAGAHRRAFSTPVALGTGFAIVFGLWLLWGYQLGRSLQNIEHSVATVHEEYVRGEQTLSKVRTSVLLGSIYLRDALIDNGSPRREVLPGRAVAPAREVERRSHAYVPEVTSVVERQHWSWLQSELGQFWESRDIALTDIDPRSPAQAAALLRTRVVPRRETILQVLDQLGGAAGRSQPPPPGGGQRALSSGASAAHVDGRRDAAGGADRRGDGVAARAPAAARNRAAERRRTAEPAGPGAAVGAPGGCAGGRAPQAGA